MGGRLRALALALVTLVHSAGFALAQETKLEVRDGDTVRSVLERHVGKRVTVVTAAGSELSGVVVKVAGHVVHLSELSGREFFDAVIALDRISAVVVRVRTR
jgi:phage-related minor tail protein